jgi:hypothetical protein
MRGGVRRRLGRRIGSQARAYEGDGKQRQRDNRINEMAAHCAPHHMAKQADTIPVRPKSDNRALARGYMATCVWLSNI